MLFVLLAACYRPASSYESCAIACTDTCPPGFTCDRGLCRADDGAACMIDAPTGAELAQDAMLDAAPNVCPTSYNRAITATMSKYRVVTAATTWTAAAADCADDLAGTPKHTHLVVITSDLELSQVDALDANMIAWAGISDRKTQGAFLHVTAEPTTYPTAMGPPWATNQPNMGAGLDCVEMTLAQLSTRLCTEQKGYYCECDDYANDSTRY